jgi:hypothetical protein
LLLLLVLVTAFSPLLLLLLLLLSQASFFLSTFSSSSLSSVLSLGSGIGEAWRRTREGGSGREYWRDPAAAPAAGEVDGVCRRLRHGRLEDKDEDKEGRRNASVVVLVVTAAKTVRVRTEERMRGIFYLERRSLQVLGRGNSEGDVDVVLILLFFSLLDRG